MRLVRMIAENVYDTSKAEVLRCAAYRSLCKLRRSAHLAVARRHLFTAKGFRFPEDVDWRFVDTFLFGGQRNSPINPNDLLFL